MVGFVRAVGSFEGLFGGFVWRGALEICFRSHLLVQYESISDLECPKVRCM